VEILQSSGRVWMVHAQMDDIVEGIISLKQFPFVYEPVLEYLSSFCKEEGMYQGCPNHQTIRKLMLVKIAQIFMSYYYKPMLFKAQAISEANNLTNEQIFNVVMERFHVFADEKWGCNLQTTSFVAIIHDTKQFLDCLFQTVISENELPLIIIL
jgi:hypothetical protein